ncbi:YheC/D like ATP-grasp [Alicyclobacillus hesperidum]|uniref:YheC/D like ATP-grasp n=1 Tax=Alicyclobacillus hesperidum TaxID=89784 RepID=A0A1H2Q2F2_9BACL|nr:YheC/YheD family protein [Alicyclobacillus hesperidum]SDW00649.1 YheC/D like ATP-grasp [Alicyclobacillus hesperidum]
MARKPELGKWLLYRFFARHMSARKHLPTTRKYNEKALAAMLQAYGAVYIKPAAGSRGRGVMKVWKRQSRVIVQHTVHKPIAFNTLGEACTYIKRLQGDQVYIVQQAIHLLHVEGRPMDVRVMMQRERPGGKWLYSGMVAKVAGPHSIVTNVALSRGAVMSVDRALRQAGWTTERTEHMKSRLIELAHEWAKHFDTYQPYRELGFDIAIDTRGRIWLLEENTGPSHRLFAKSIDGRADYRRIQNRWRRYERARRSSSLHARNTPTARREVERVAVKAHQDLA